MCRGPTGSPPSTTAVPEPLSVVAAPGSEHGELAGGDRFAVDPHVARQRQDRELGEGRCEWDGGVGVEHDLGQEQR